MLCWSFSSKLNNSEDIVNKLGELGVDNIIEVCGSTSESWWSLLKKSVNSRTEPSIAFVDTGDTDKDLQLVLALDKRGIPAYYEENGKLRKYH